MTKIFKVFFALLCGGLLTACTGKLDAVPEGVPSYDDETTAVTFSLSEDEPAPGTKATPSNLIDEDTVTEWFILGFDAVSGDLVFGYKPESPSITVQMNKTKITNLNIYVFANAGNMLDWQAYSKESDLLSANLDIHDHLWEAMPDINTPMYKVFYNYNLSESPNLSISLERMFCKIMLTSLWGDVDDYGFDITIDAIYLINVHSRMLLSDFLNRTVPTWYETGIEQPWFYHISPFYCSNDNTLITTGYPRQEEGYNDEGDVFPPYGIDLCGTAYGNPVAQFTDDETHLDPSEGETIAYYCLPNFRNIKTLGTRNSTKLVIHATIESDDEPEWNGSFYYSVPIADPSTGTMAPNSVYRVSVILWNLGYKYPDVEDGDESWCLSKIRTTSWKQITYSESM